MLRPLELKLNDDLVVEQDENPTFIKEGIFYLNEKTKQMTDEEYESWLKRKLKTGNVDEKCMYDIENDLFTPKFSFLQKKVEQTKIGVDTCIDALLLQNNLISLTNSHENLIPDYVDSK